MEDLELVPVAPNLIESTRSIGYSFETALADVVDNSISNSAHKIDIKFDMADGNPYIAIIDDGIGMSSSMLIEAMRYGSVSSLDKREENDLGRFGLGLKMASMSQCRCLTVITKFSNEFSAATWDLDYINKTGKWLLIRYSKDQISKLKFYNELKKKNNGTVVLWEKLDKISESPNDFEKEFNEKMNFADKHLSLVFHRYLNKKVNIFFNNRKLEAIDPFMTSNKATQKLEEETIFIDKTAIKVIPYITPYANKLSLQERQFLNDNKDLHIKQGLYIYRNKRLIVWGKWFRLLSDKELQRLAKIQIDLPNSMDSYWKIDVKKSSAQIPSMIKDVLKQIVVRSVGKSEKVYRYRGRKIANDAYEHIWEKINDRGKVQYQVNREIPFYRAFMSTLNEEQSSLFEGFVKSLEDSFPYASVYYDLSKNEGEYEETVMENEEIYQLARNTIDVLADNKNAQIATIKTMQNIDLFQKYPNVLKLIQEEIMNEE